MKSFVRSVRSVRSVRAICLLALSGMVGAVAVAETLEVSGSTTVQTRIFENTTAALKTATGMDIKFLPVGSGKGLIALADGKVSVSATSEPLADTIKSAEKAARELDKTFTAPSNLKFHELARDEIVVIVHKDNPVQALSKAQLKDLNTGKVTNWKDVGGPDVPVKVVTSHAGSATRGMFQKMVMDGSEYMASAVEIRTTKEEITEVGKDKGAIGAVSEAFFAANPGKVKTVKAPEMVRPLALVTVGTPKPEVQKMIDFLQSKEGKKLMK